MACGCCVIDGRTCSRAEREDSTVPHRARIEHLHVELPCETRSSTVSRPLGRNSRLRSHGTGRNDLIVVVPDTTLIRALAPKATRPSMAPRRFSPLVTAVL